MLAGFGVDRCVDAEAGGLNNHPCRELA